MSTERPLFSRPLSAEQYKAFHVDSYKLVTELYARRAELETRVTQEQAISLFEQILLSGDITKLIVTIDKPDEIKQQLIYVPGKQADYWKSKYDELRCKWNELKATMIDTFEINCY